MYFLMSRDDGRLDVAVAIQHVAEYVMQPGEWRRSGDVVGTAHFLFRDQPERAAHGFRRVMERGLEGDLGIMQPLRVELNLGAGGASAKEVDGAPLADHIHGPFPGLWTSYRLDHHVIAA